MAKGGGSLLRLFRAECFDAHFHMYYLFHMEHSGIQDYLVNELYKMTDADVDYHLPQLCQLAVMRFQTSSLKRFLADKAAESMHFALRIRWLLSSLAEETQPEVSELISCRGGISSSEYALALLDMCETALVNRFGGAHAITGSSPACSSSSSLSRTSSRPSSLTATSVGRREEEEAPCAPAAAVASADCSLVAGRLPSRRRPASWSGPRRRLSSSPCHHADRQNHGQTLPLPTRAPAQPSPWNGDEDEQEGCDDEIEELDMEEPGQTMLVTDSKVSRRSSRSRPASRSSCSRSSSRARSRQPSPPGGSDDSRGREAEAAAAVAAATDLREHQASAFARSQQLKAAANTLPIPLAKEAQGCFPPALSQETTCSPSRSRNSSGLEGGQRQWQRWQTRHRRCYSLMLPSRRSCRVASGEHSERQARRRKRRKSRERPLRRPSESWSAGLLNLRNLSDKNPEETQRRKSGARVPSYGYFPDVYADLGDPVAPAQLLLDSYSESSQVVAFLKKRRLCDNFTLQTQLVSWILRLSSSLLSFTEKIERIACLKGSLGLFNRWLLDRRVLMTFEHESMLSCLCLHLPTPGGLKSSHHILHFHVEACRIFSSATRTPFLLVYETVDLDEIAHGRHNVDFAACVNHELTAGGIPNAEGFQEDQASDPNNALWTRISTITSRQWRKLAAEAPRAPLVAATAAVSAAAAAGGAAASLGTAAACSPRRSEGNGDNDGDGDNDGAGPSSNLATEDTANADGEAKSERTRQSEEREEPVSAVVSAPAEDYYRERRSRLRTRRAEAAQRIRTAIWGEAWKTREERLRRASAYGHFKSWSLQGLMVKAGDDVRQEVLASQIMEQFAAVFAQAKLPLWLRPTKVVVTSAQSGFIEYIRDSTSLDGMKKQFPGKSLAEIFKAAFADCLFEAKRNFIESCAAYSLITWFLQVKDRHNGNLMIDAAGHLMHIDFGFMLSNSPGSNMAFEQAPFKLTQEFLDVMEGEESEEFRYFRHLIIRGFLESRKHMEKITLPIQMMIGGSKLPCFREGPEAVIHNLRERFFVNLTEEACVERIAELIESSTNNWRTTQYDNYQRLVNGIV